MKTNEQMLEQTQIVITAIPEDKKQSLPLNVIISLALGTLAGVALILGMFIGANYLVNL